MKRNQRQETVRTAMFAALALVFAVAAWGVHRWMQPAPLTGFEHVGKPFFENFEDPNAVASLQVAAYDESRGRTNVFTVERQGDQWRIPSHFGYPAEAKTQVAKAATSLMGVERETVAGRSQKDHQRFGVVDPIAPPSSTTRGWGTRITLLDEKRNTLADYIVGNEVEGGRDRRYVRRPDETATYVASISLKLSTKFTEWIERDLLKLNSYDVARLELHVPKWERREAVTPRGIEIREVQVGDEVTRVDRPDSGGKWQLDGLNEESEEVNERPIDDAIRAVSDLEIINVRRKPKGLQADLSFDPESDPGDVLGELEARGFILATSRDGKRRFLFSRAGELIVASRAGAIYHLHFGERARGAAEISVDTGESPAASEDKEKSDETTDKQSDGNAGKTSDDEGAELNEGRYLFVRVEFDPKLLGEEPVAPTPPEKPPVLEKVSQVEKAEQPGNGEAPANAQPDESSSKDEKSGEADAQSSAADTSDSAGNKPDDAGKSGEADEAEPGTNQKDDSEKSELDEIRRKYESDLAQYESQKKRYEEALKEYTEKVEKGRREVEILNQRFGDWYYIISDKSFDKLQFSREDLIQPKEKPTEEKDDADDTTSESADEKPASSTDASAVPADAPAEKPAEPAAPEEPVEKPAAEAAPETKETDSAGQTEVEAAPNTGDSATTPE